MSPRPPLLPLLLGLAALAGCGPNYVDRGEGESGWTPLSEVTFQVHDAFKAAPPDCVAVLPLTVQTPSQPMANPDDAAKVRLSLYAHLATQSRRGIRLQRVDHVAAETKGDRAALAERLKCGAVLEGEVTEYGSIYLGLYSRVAVGADLKMVRAADGVLLWEGKHTAVSHGGSLPLDPVGIAITLIEAASNVLSDEQILRVTDDLNRRLVSTIPDNKVAALDDPVAEPERLAAAPVTSEPPKPAAPADDLAQAEQLLAQGDHAGAQAAAERALAAQPDRAEAWFMKARLQILERDYAKAEPAILKAVALDRGNARYLNALGVVNTEKGLPERALAAYRMAIDANPANGFAWYNSGVLHFNAGNPAEAADAFYGAGLAYLKTGDYAKAERALSDLKDLAKTGIPVQSQIKTIEDALTDLTRRTS